MLFKKILSAWRDQWRRIALLAGALALFGNVPGHEGFDTYSPVIQLIWWLVSGGPKPFLIFWTAIWFLTYSIGIFLVLSVLVAAWRGAHRTPNADSA